MCIHYRPTEHGGYAFGQITEPEPEYCEKRKIHFCSEECLDCNHYEPAPEKELYMPVNYEIDEKPPF